MNPDVKWPPNPQHQPETQSTATLQSFDDPEGGLPLDAPEVQARRQQQHGRPARLQPMPADDNTTGHASRPGLGGALNKAERTSLAPTSATKSNWGGLRPGRGRAYALPLPQIRTCPIKASGSSTGGLAASPATGRRRLSTLSSEVTVTRNEAAKCSPWCPPLGPPVGSALPSPGSAEVRSPASTVLWRCATPCAPLAALRCLRLAIPCGAPVVSLPAVQDARPRAWGSSSGPHNRKVAAGRQSGPPRFPCNPLSLCPVLRPRQDRTHQAITVQRHGPRYVHGEGSHDLSSFRGSIARPWDWLFTLRPVRCRTRRKTRFRLLAKAAGRGSVPRRVATKGFG